MGTELKLETGTLYAFLLVLTRVSGAFIFVPLPGIKAEPDMIRAALAGSITLALMPSGQRSPRPALRSERWWDGCWLKPDSELQWDSP
jgi:flagellar biosynthesis protein FliR